MTDVERCFQCYKIPDITVEDKGFDAVNLIFSCQQHGHMAMGSTLEGAKANWNLYIKLMKVKVA